MTQCDHGCFVPKPLCKSCVIVAQLRYARGDEITLQLLHGFGIGAISGGAPSSIPVPFVPA